jgi:ABC-type transport system substrate-binding protein
MDASPDLLGKGGVGAGPFILDTWGFEAGAKFTKNPTYWEQAPLADGINFAHLPDPTTLYAAIIAGNIDISTDDTAVHPGKQRTDDLKKSKPNDYLYADASTGVWTHVKFNVSVPPFNDERIRKAFHLVIDRDEYGLLAYEGGFSTQGAFGPQAMAPWGLTLDQLSKLPGYRTPKDQDISDARKLLSAAGAEKLQITMKGLGGAPSVSAYEKGQLAVRDQWQKRLGLTIGVEFAADSTKYLAILNPSDFTAFHMAHSQGIDPDEVTSQYFVSKGSRNYNKINDPQVDALSDKVSTTFDKAQRKAACDELQNYMLDKAYFAFIGNPRNYFIHNSKLVGWLKESYNGAQWRWADKFGLAT